MAKADGISCSLRLDDNMLSKQLTKVPNPFPTVSHANILIFYQYAKLRTWY